jgi:hypothetical protein
LALQWVLPLHFRGYNYKVIISAILPWVGFIMLGIKSPKINT